LIATFIGLWQIKERTRWVVATDRLHFIDGTGKVRVCIPFADLAAVEMCWPSKNDAPFIGLRLLEPKLLKTYAGSSPLRYGEIHEDFGYDWCIAQADSQMPLRVVLEKVQVRLQQWHAGAPRPPSCGIAPSLVTKVTRCRRVQEDFTKNHP
jgi:hypothetical protein